MQRIDGKALAREIEKDLSTSIANWEQKPGLAVVRVGDDPASIVYIRHKQKACERVGIYSEVHELPESARYEEVAQTLESLNQSPKIHGILLQLPLPSGLDSNRLLQLISPQKDVDGFHPYNLGCLMSGIPGILPCTPAGIMQMLQAHSVELEGKKAVVVGRSNIVGKPIAQLLTAANATVTLCHSRTVNLKQHTQTADIIIAAVGRPKFITGDMVKEGAVLIDVGINRLEGKLVGDIDFDTAAPKASLITPVPGGVGPMTVAMLLKNTVEAAQRSLL